MIDEYLGRIGLRVPPLLQFMGAFGALVLAVASPFLPPRNGADDVPFAKIYILVAIVLVIGGTVELLVRGATRALTPLWTSAWGPLPDSAIHRGAFSLPLVVFSAIILLSGLCVLGLRMQDEAAPWSWRAPLALAVSEMIYLTRVFEGFLEVSMRDRMERTNQTKSDHSVAVDSDQTASNSATKHSKKPGML